MTARRGPQRSEDRSDLTPAEARAEVEAFMGEGWDCTAGPYASHDGAMPRPHVRVYFGDCIELAATEGTYRAAVSALKAAWREAVRPWVANGVCSALDSLYLDTLTTEPAKPTDAHAAPIISSVLKEDGK